MCISVNSQPNTQHQNQKSKKVTKYAKTTGKIWINVNSCLIFFTSLSLFPPYMDSLLSSWPCVSATLQPNGRANETVTTEMVVVVHRNLHRSKSHFLRLQTLHEQWHIDKDVCVCVRALAFSIVQKTFLFLFPFSLFLFLFFSFCFCAHSAKQIYDNCD